MGAREACREVCGSIILGSKNLKSEWRNHEVKAVKERKEFSRNSVFGIRGGECERKMHWNL